MSDIYQGAKNIYHFFQAHWWRLFYGRPDAGMTIFGVTGTNGKTTTCYILTSILGAAFGEEKVGMLTTVEFKVGKDREFNKTKMTTLPSRKVYRYLRMMKQRGVTHVVLEVTSHALHQHRLAGLTFQGAAILNLAREHLDYHRTMARYQQAKAQILSYVVPGGPVVGKGDDALAREILNTAQKRGFQVHRFTTESAKTASTPLLGDVNKENAIAARLLAEAAGIDRSAIERGIAAVTAVPGRMEWLTSSDGVRAVIDYAVTPDALLRLYVYVRSQTQDRVLAVLGAAGLRDRGKRPDMARIVAQHADEIVVTNEDPWTEPEEQIFSDLEAGLPARRSLGEGGKDTKAKWQRIPDRREALRYLVSQAKPGDIVVATGKGAERGMGIGKKIVPWNEREIILELFRELKK